MKWRKPEITLKTSFWDETRIPAWRKRTEKIAFLYGIFILMNIVYNLTTNNYIMTFLNLLPFTFTIIVYRSYAKYNGQKE